MEKVHGKRCAQLTFTALQHIHAVAEGKQCFINGNEDIGDAIGASHVGKMVHEILKIGIGGVEFLNHVLHNGAVEERHLGGFRDAEIAGQRQLLEVAL